MHVIWLALIALFGASLWGCSGDSNDFLNRTSPIGVELSPADGATGVALDAPIVLRFDAAVDRLVVERGFHLTVDGEMTDSTCTHDASPCDSMMAGMMDSMMAGMMDEPHSMGMMEGGRDVGGRLSWDGSSTRCVFQPEEPLAADTGYIIHLDAGVMTMMGHPMEGHGGEMNHGMDGDGMDGMMSRFRTGAQPGGDSGHGDHHGG